MRVKSVPRQRRGNQSIVITNTAKPQPTPENLTPEVDQSHSTGCDELSTRRVNFEAPVRSSPLNLVRNNRMRDVATNTEPTNTEPDSQALNLCLKDLRSATEEQPSIFQSWNGDGALYGSLLYQIMTDPTFVENIRRKKKSKTWTCQFCKQPFVKENDLQDHLDFRKDQLNRVTCCACNKVFAQKRYLRYHQRCHTDKNKFVCKICNKQYSRMDNLTRHHIYHTNPNKFSCPFCEKSFARKDLMTKHVKRHETTEPRFNGFTQLFPTPTGSPVLEGLLHSHLTRK